MENAVTPKRAAELLGVHPYTVYKLLKSGRLRGFRLNSHWRITMEALNEFAAGQRRRND